MISDAFLNTMFYINILILIAFTKEILNLSWFGNDRLQLIILNLSDSIISPINLLIMQLSG